MEDLEKSLSNNKLRKIASEAFDNSSPNLKRSEFKKLLIETPESVGTFMNAMIENHELEGLIFFSSLGPTISGFSCASKAFHGVLVIFDNVESN